MVQTVHATHQYHGEPWHDFVAVLGEVSTSTGRKEEVEWYAQLRMLFWWGDQQLSLRQMAAGRKRFGARQTHRALRSTAGCKAFRLESQAYDVIPFDTIRRRVYIVPDFGGLPSGGGLSMAAKVQRGDLALGAAIAKATRLYEASPLKWDTSIPDYRTWADREAPPAGADI